MSTVEPLTRARLPDQAGRALKQLILQEQLMPGARLPSERELTELLGVSRTVVREALRALVDEGLLQKEASRGVYVREFDALALEEELTGDVSPSVQTRGLLEVRAALEIGALPFIAQRITATELDTLRAIVAQMQQQLAAAQPLGEADQRFHEALLAAMRNPTFRYFKELVQEAIHAAAQGSMLAYVTPNDPQTVQTAEQIVAALQRKDVEEAQRAMRAHLLIDRPPEQARVFLFVDDGDIAAMHNIQRRITPAHKHPHNPILRAEFPWEGESVLPSATVLYDQERMIYQLWYHGHRALSPREELTSLCYATSIDGIHWRKPALGVLAATEAERMAAWESNLLVPWGSPQQGDVTSATVLYDPTQPAARRFQLIYVGTGTSATGLCVATAADGLRWTPNAENPVQLGGPEPVGDALYCLPDLHGGPPGDGVVAYYRIPRRLRTQATIGRMESRDLRHWQNQQPVLTTDATDAENAEIIGLTPFRYGELTLGLLWLQRPQQLRAGAAVQDDAVQDGAVQDSAVQDIVELQLVASRDGITWTRVGDRTPLLSPGQAGDFDAAAIVRATTPVVHQDELWFYYAGADQPINGWQPPRYRIGLATLALDRFVAMEATAQEGTLTTTAITNGEQSDLLVNAVVNPNGYLLVEVLDESGEPIAGFTRADSIPFTASAVYHPMRWQTQTSLETLGERTFHLRFILCNASLYAFRLAQPNAGPSDLVVGIC